MAISTINPATDQQERVYSEYSDAKVNSILNSVTKSSMDWRNNTVSERARLIKKVGNHLLNNTESLANLITLEMGKPIKQARAEIEKCAAVCEYYAKHGIDFLENRAYESDGSQSYVQYQAMGTILAVMPWNYPFWQVFRFAAPTLLAGNAVVLKHASNVPKCALAIEKLFVASGLPKNVFRTLLITGKNAQKLLDDDRIQAVSLTGSEHAGKKVAAAAGNNIKKSVLELGGSDAFIVLADADIDQAVEVGIQARYQNSGQSCIAAKRFILVEEIAEKFVEKFTSKVASLNVNDPTWENTDIGPMARKDLARKIHQQVKQSVGKGANLLHGGKHIKGKGYYYPATILDNVKPGMSAYEEELFGPVASIIRVKNDKEAIIVANDTCFGLGSSVWSKNVRKALKYSGQIEAGATFINEMVKSDPRLRFGGIKNSGFGRELSDFGILEFVNIKTVYVK